MNWFLGAAILAAPNSYVNLTCVSSLLVHETIGLGSMDFKFSKIKDKTFFSVLLVFIIMKIQLTRALMIQSIVDLFIKFKCNNSKSQNNL